MTADAFLHERVGSLAGTASLLACNAFSARTNMRDRESRQAEKSNQMLGKDLVELFKEMSLKIGQDYRP
jgi:hypothetical protein